MPGWDAKKGEAPKRFAGKTTERTTVAGRVQRAAVRSSTRSPQLSRLLGLLRLAFFLGGHERRFPGKLFRVLRFGHGFSFV
jgi:hypothetical protein